MLKMQQMKTLSRNSGSVDRKKNILITFLYSLDHRVTVQKPGKMPNFWKTTYTRPTSQPDRPTKDLFGKHGSMVP